MADLISRLLHAWRSVRKHHLFAARLPFDLFISYGTKDAASYASALERYFRERGMVTFLDRHIISAGAPFESILMRGLRRSQVLVLVLSDAAHDSWWVQWEVEKFGGFGKRIVAIRVTNDSRVSPLTEAIEGLVYLSEDAARVQDGTPSEETIDQIARSLRFTTRNRRMRRLVAGLAVIFVLLMLAAVLHQVVIDRLLNR